MITLEKAIELAKTHNEKYNSVQEYADAYEFFIDDGMVREGGGDCSIIISKKTGELKRWADYFLKDNKEAVEVGKPKRLDNLI